MGYLRVVLGFFVSAARFNPQWATHFLFVFARILRPLDFALPPRHLFCGGLFPLNLFLTFQEAVLATSRHGSSLPDVLILDPYPTFIADNASIVVPTRQIIDLS
jgi:hypothetical protein